MRTLVDRYIDAYNRMNVDEMLLTVHPEVEFRNIAGGVVNASASGVAALKALAQHALALFSERHQDILTFEADRSRAVAGIAFRAVVANDLPNGLKKGHVMHLTGRSEFEFRDRTISSITDIS
jgi:hypothetical protein